MQLVVVGSAWDSDCDQENEAMSQFNGDKARFNRERRQNIHRRKRTRELLQPIGLDLKTVDGSKKSNEVSNRAKERV